MATKQITQADLDAANAGAVLDAGLPDNISADSGVPDINTIIRNGPMAELLGIRDPSDRGIQQEKDDGKEPDVDDGNAEDELPPEDDDTGATEEEADVDEDAEPEEDTDDKGTAEVTEDDIDWEYQIPIKVGDKTEKIPLKTLQETYLKSQEIATKEADLEKARGTIETDRQTALADLVTLGSQLGDVLLNRENALISQYSKIKKEQETAKESGDSYQARELKEKMTDIQEEYWGVRRSRESHLKQIAEKIQNQELENRKKLMETFSSEIKGLVPEYSDALAKNLRQFALEEGLPVDIVDSIFSAPVVKVLNEYRKLKTSLKAGQVKREKSPPPKKTPIKQGLSSTPARAAAAKQSALRQKVLSGEGDEAQQMDFMKSLVKQKF